MMTQNNPTRKDLQSAFEAKEQSLYSLIAYNYKKVASLLDLDLTQIALEPLTSNRGGWAGVVTVEGKRVTTPDFTTPTNDTRVMLLIINNLSPVALGKHTRNGFEIWDGIKEVAL